MARGLPSKTEDRAKNTINVADVAAMPALTSFTVPTALAAFGPCGFIFSSNKRTGRREKVV